MKKTQKAINLHKFLNSPESIQNAYLHNRKAPQGSRYIKKTRPTFISELLGATLAGIVGLAVIILLMAITN